MRALLALLVTTASLAGCFAATEGNAPLAEGATLESPVRFDTVLAEHTPIAAADSTTLDSWVFRPDTDEPVPVIINFSPYWHNLAPPASTGGDAFSLYLIDYFVPRGYAVALVSARGTGMSEGCFTIGGPTEVDDADAVATFLGTAPWSNGNVTATGKSYDGTIANGLLTRNNPHVKTIVPVSPISELYKYNYFGGVPYTLTGQVFNTYYVVETSLTQDVNPFGGNVVPNPTYPTYEKTPTRFCAESLDVQAYQLHGALTGDYGDYWQARNYTALLPDQVTASVFHVHGLQDWNVKPDHMTPWIDALLQRNATVKMWLGQWAHDYPHRDDWNATLLQWLDHELKGIPNGAREEALVNVQDLEGIWRTEDAWPAPRATPLLLHPSADGTLAPGAGAGESTYRDAPETVGPIPSTVAFRTEPFTQDVRLVGAPTFYATVSSTMPRATLSLTLKLDDKVIDHGFLDLAHRRTLERTEPMTPGAAEHVVVAFYPQDVRIPAGSTLTLEIGHVPGPGALAEVLPVPTNALVTIQHGESTYLALPVIAGDDVAIEDPQPTDVGCWTC